MHSKDYAVYELYSLYGKMLTAAQAQAVEDYYGFDLSLAEIAENCGVSRQAVSDALIGAKKQLFAIEEKIGLQAKIKAVANLKNGSNDGEITRVLEILEG